MEELLRSYQAAKMLAISETTLRKLVKNGEIKSVKLDRAVRFREEDIKSFIERKLTNE